jgi:hypothetical protein
MIISLQMAAGEPASKASFQQPPRNYEPDPKAAQK